MSAHASGTRLLSAVGVLLLSCAAGLLLISDSAAKPCREGRSQGMPVAVWVNCVPLLDRSIEAMLNPPGMFPPYATRQSVIEGFISAELLSAEGERLRLAPSDAEVQSAIANLRASTPQQAINLVLAIAHGEGNEMTVDEYWDSEYLFRNWRREMTIVRFKKYVRHKVRGQDIDPDTAFMEEYQRLRSNARVDILRP